MFLQGKTIHDSIVEVSKWLTGQIQQEREGWAYKIKMAMQEIESHRRETLRAQGIIQECVGQLKLLAECCSVDRRIMDTISGEETKKALPMYIECLAELINSLVEDRIECLQILHTKENDHRMVSHILQHYVTKLESTTEKVRLDYKDKVIQMERENSKLVMEMNKMKKHLGRLQEDHDKLRMILQVNVGSFYFCEH